MKLRQKLAVVLATAMVASSVPVITMAASDNGMLREVLKVKKDTQFTERTTAGGIEIKLKDAWQGKEEVFYMTLTNAEWNDDARLAMVNALGDTSLTEAKKNVVYPILAKNIFKGESSVAKVGEIVFSGDKEAKVKIYDDGTIATNMGSTFKKLDQVVQVPLLVKATGGDAKVKLEKSGSNATITDGEWSFATTSEKKFSFTNDDPEVVYQTGKLANVTFSENFSGAFVKGDRAFIEYELQDGDYKFDFGAKSGASIVSTSTTIPGSNDNDRKYTEYKLSGDFFEKSYGFIGADIDVYAFVDNDDEGRCVFEFVNNDNNKSDSIGKIKLKDIPVRNDEKAADIQEGDLLVDIQNYGHGTTDFLDNGKDDVKLAKIVKYSTYIKMKDDKPVDVVAGRVKEITFEVGENIDDSMVGDRELEISLVDDLAHFDYAKGTTLYTYSINGGTVSTPYGDKGKDDILDDQSEYEWNSNHSGKEKLVQSIKVDPDNNSKLIVKLNPKAQINGEKDKIKLKIKVCVPVGYKDKETVTLKASGRAIEEGDAGITTTAINIKKPFDVTDEEIRVKVGQQNQVGGHVTITETDKEMFNKGKIYLTVVDPATGKTVNGISFYTDKESKDYVTYTTSGDIKKADLDSVIEDGMATIKLKRQSKSASTLDLKDFHVTVDRTVPQGKYDLVLTGDAISEHYYETANANTADAKTTTTTTTSLTANYGYNPDSNGTYVKTASGTYVLATSAEGEAAINAGYTTKYSYGVVSYTGTTKNTANSTKYANDSKYNYADDKQAKAHEIVIPDFFVVGTPNTEDIAANGLRKGTASFVIGESKYTANGEVYTMDAQSFIQDNYSMVPARYVAEAFGITTDNILFSGGTATIFAGERTIQLTNGSNIATVNGAAIKMGTKMVIKDGRTYIPVGEIARILGIKTNWIAESKTAEFINE